MKPTREQYHKKDFVFIPYSCQECNSKVEFKPNNYLQFKHKLCFDCITQHHK